MKKIRIFSLFLIALLIFSSVMLPKPPEVEAITNNIYKSDSPVLASETDFQYRIQNNRIFLTAYIGKDTKIIIPETIENLPVYAIIAKTFTGSDITYIKIPSTVANIGSNTFSECDSLTQIDVDENNAKFCSIDGVLYSKDKTTLKAFPAGRDGSFLIPKSVTTIANFAFYRCYQLEHVNMYNNVTSIGERAFSFCWNLETIRLSDTLKTIGALAFSHCDDLTKIELPKSINSIGTDAFLGRVNSNDSSKEYYFVDGIYCQKGTYPAKYIKSLGLDYINTHLTYTNVETGITVTDLSNSFPAGADLKVIIQPLSSVESSIKNLKYSDSLVVDIYLSVDDKISVPDNTQIRINFDDASKSFSPTATRLYSLQSNKAKLINNQLSLKSLSFEISSLGTFILLSSDDFALKGDANGDGLITTIDARIALLASMNVITLSKEQKDACDVVTTGINKNVITSADARRILRTAVGLK